MPAAEGAALTTSPRAEQSMKKRQHWYVSADSAIQYPSLHPCTLTPPPHPHSTPAPSLHLPTPPLPHAQPSPQPPTISKGVSPNWRDEHMPHLPPVVVILPVHYALPLVSGKGVLCTRSLKVLQHIGRGCDGSGAANSQGSSSLLLILLRVSRCN